MENPKTAGSKPMCSCCGRLRPRPTDALPGTPEKAAVIADRLFFGECCNHTQDRKLGPRDGYVGDTDGGRLLHLEAVVEEVSEGLLVRSLCNGTALRGVLERVRGEKGD